MAEPQIRKIVSEQIPMFPDREIDGFIVEAIRTFENDENIYVEYLKRSGIRDKNKEMSEVILGAVRLFVGEKNNIKDNISKEKLVKQIRSSKLSSSYLRICGKYEFRKNNNGGNKEKTIEAIDTQYKKPSSDKPDYKSAAAGEEVERRNER